VILYGYDLAHQVRMPIAGRALHPGATVRALFAAYHSALSALIERTARSREVAVRANRVAGHNVLSFVKQCSVKIYQAVGRVSGEMT